MALLKLYRGVAAPALETGKIWFDSENQVIKVCTTTTPAEGSDGWEPYGLSEAEIAALILAAKNEVLGTLEEGDSATLKALNEEIDDLQAELAALAAKTVTITEKADGHVTVSKTVDEKGATVYTVGENDIASAKGLEDEIKRAGDEEARIEGLVTAEAARAAKAEEALAGRLDVIEGEGEGSIKKAVADAKAELIGDAETLKTFGAVEDALAQMSADAKTYSIAKVTEGLGTNIKEAYKLVDEDGTQCGTLIEIEKDDSLVDVVTTTDEAGNQVVKFTYNLADGTSKEVTIDLSAYVTESEYGDGLQVVDHVVSVKKDATSEAFLTVGADGVKLSGVQDAIDAAKGEAIAAIAPAIEALDADVTSAEKYTVTTTAEDGTESTEEVNHKVRVQVVEVDGVVTGVNVTESDIASAAALATLDAEVQEHEVVVAAALNDLNARVDGHATRLDELEAGLGAVEHTTVSDGDAADFVAITETTEGSHKNYAVSATVVKGANGGDAGLATDAYVREQITAAALAWEEGSF